MSTPGKHGGFNPFRDAHGRFAAGPAASSAAMNTRIRQATGRTVERDPLSAQYFNGQRHVTVVEQAQATVRQFFGYAVPPAQPGGPARYDLAAAAAEGAPGATEAPARPAAQTLTRTTDNASSDYHARRAPLLRSAVRFVLPTAQEMPIMNWKSLIVAHEDVNPLDLEAHPQNFRTHPLQQRKVVNAAIDELGYVDEVIANRRTQRIVNGHLRVELAIGNGEATIPVTWIDCDEQTEVLVLAFFDRVGELAKEDGAKVRKNVEGMTTDNASLQDMLDEWVATFETYRKPQAVAAASPPAAPAAAPAAPAVGAAVAAAAVTAAVAEPPTAPEAANQEPMEAPDGLAGAVASPVVEAAAPTAHAPADDVEHEAAPTPAAPEAALETAPAAETASTGDTAAEAPSVTVAPETTPTVTAEAAPAAPGEPVAAPAVPVAAADPFAQAVVDDSEPEALVVLPPAPAKPVKEPMMTIKVGEYTQEIPKHEFVPWWNDLVAEAGNEYPALVTAICRRLDLPIDQVEG